MDILLPKNGEGFTLRSFMREDIEQLADIEFDPEVKRYLALPIKRKSQWIKELEINIYNGNAIEVNGVIAGRASLLRVSKGEHRGSRELAIIIARPFWGSRLGRKVTKILIKATFDELNTNVIIAKAHPENHASIALLQAFKFCQYGIVDEPDGNWQQGHFIYCLSGNDYKTMCE